MPSHSHRRRRRLLAVLGFAFATLGAAAAPAQPQVDVFHWWVSGGERASMDVIRTAVERRGVVWKEASVAGSGTERYTRVLDARVRSGKGPTAAQMIGHDIQTWARRGLLADLDEVAEKEEWQTVVPLDIQNLSKFDGKWVAAPFNIHSTNWLWVNQILADRLGATEPPDTWEDLVALLEKAQRAGMVPLAIGKEPWEHTLLFELVAAGVMGASSYRKTFIQLDASALTQREALMVFARMRTLSTYIDGAFMRRRWDEATDMVRKGSALMQAQGSWVIGEFTAHGLQPGWDYACWRFPDTQGVFLFNSDHFVFFRQNGGDRAAQLTMASALMSPVVQTAVNLRSGAAPARVDVHPSEFNACGRRAIADMRASNMRRTLLGSIAMGNAHHAAVKTAIYAVVSSHLRGKLSDQEAATRLRQALLQTDESSGKSARTAP